MAKGDEEASLVETRYSFNVNWFDNNAQLMKEYRLLYFPDSNCVEMFDLKSHRTFLKKVPYDGLKLADFYIGGTVNIYSRQLEIVGFGDNYTSRALSPKRESVLFLVKHSGVDTWLGNILDIITEKEIFISKLKMGFLNPNAVSSIFPDCESAASLVESPVVIMQLMTQDALAKVKEMVDEINEKARADVCSSSSSLEDATRTMSILFDKKANAMMTSAKVDNSTLCVIKPHAILAGHAGKIVSSIAQSGFRVTAMEMFHLQRANVEEFLEVYKGVVPEYHAMVNEFASGGILALEIQASDELASAEGEDKPCVVQQFRGLVGPPDPELARHLRPKTLRARFGNDKIQNSVHCTDLPDDGILEVEYFFRILQ
eukprot:Nk52_evm1s875 gene=Nk52_evmTU1s875